MTKLFRSALAALALLLAPVSAYATNLCNVGITTAVTGSAQTAVAGFGTPAGLTIQGRFTYVASAATSADVYVQTTVDGSNWIDVADFHWTTATAQQVVNLVGATVVSAPASITDGSLTSNTVQQGVLGSQYRCKITTVGTYGAGSNITVDVLPRY